MSHTGCYPAFRVTVKLYKNSLAAIIRHLRSKGVKIEILRDINLDYIEQPTPQRFFQVVQPAVLYKQRNGSPGRLSGKDITDIFELNKLESDIYALLYLIYDLLTNEIETFSFVSPVKLYTTEEKKEFTWVFCIIRKINKQVFLNINGLPDDDYPIPMFPEDWNVVGFSHIYQFPLISDNSSFIREGLRN